MWDMTHSLDRHNRLLLPKGAFSILLHPVFAWFSLSLLMLHASLHNIDEIPKIDKCWWETLAYYLWLKSISPVDKTLGDKDHWLEKGFQSFCWNDVLSTSSHRVYAAVGYVHRVNLYSLLLWSHRHQCTFPEDWMPLMTARQTKIQATSRDRVIFQFRPPVSSMELVMLRVWRYQK